jgi:hypothetical protein
MADDKSRLIQVKLGLAAKYVRRARSSKSKGMKKCLLNHAQRFRMQAHNLSKSS